MSGQNPQTRLISFPLGCILTALLPLKQGALAQQQLAKNAEVSISHLRNPEGIINLYYLSKR